MLLEVGSHWPGAASVSKSNIIERKKGAGMGSYYCNSLGKKRGVVV